MKKIFLYCFLLFVLILTSCSEKEEIIKEQKVKIKELESFDMKVQVNPKNLEIKAYYKNKEYIISNPSKEYDIKDLRLKDNKLSFYIPNEDINFNIELIKNKLNINIETSKTGEFIWPNISYDDRLENIVIPYKQGYSYLNKDLESKDFLEQVKSASIEDFSMPFYALGYKNANITYIMENPFDSFLLFTKDGFSYKHEFKKNWNNRFFGFEIVFNENNSLQGAFDYRNYLIKENKFINIKNRIKNHPICEKLLGAIHFVTNSKLRDEYYEFGIDNIIKSEKEAKLNQVENKIKENIDILNKSLEEDNKLEQENNGLKEYNEEKAIENNKDYVIKSKEDRLKVIKEYDDLFARSYNKDFERFFTKFKIKDAYIHINYENTLPFYEFCNVMLERGFLLGINENFMRVKTSISDKNLNYNYLLDLIRNGSIVKENGKYLYVDNKTVLNPVISTYYVQKKLDSIKDEIDFNAVYLQEDGTLSLNDDYSQLHKSNKKDDYLARKQRARYIKDKYNLITGTKGDKVFTPFNYDYLQRALNIKDKNLKNRSQFLPLFNIVFNDSIFKIVEITKDDIKNKELIMDMFMFNYMPKINMNLYHISRNQDFIDIVNKLSKFSKQASLYAYTNYTKIGDELYLSNYQNRLLVVGNYSNEDKYYFDNKIPKKSILIIDKINDTIESIIIN